MANYKMLDGNSAVVEAMKLARVQLVSAYPITPQSSIAEQLSDLVDFDDLDAEYIRVESEHSALSCAIGAQLTGVRSATATSSVGLALMHEVVCVASGCRVPIVMPVVNRSLAAPWSLWCDHQDSMAERDSGWIQFYCESVQEVFDTVIASYRIAEHPDVLTPVMVCLDGFFLSHSMQKLLIPEQKEIDDFVGPYAVDNLKLDPGDPLIINNLIGSDQNEEFRYQQLVGFEEAKKVIPNILDEFKDRFGRSHSMIEPYRIEGADAVIVSMGSMAGTAKFVVDRMREKGINVGCLKVFCYRPFPAELIRDALKDVKRVAVIDRSGGLGGQYAPLGMETKAALGSDVILRDYVAGLAGRDVHTKTIEAVFEDILNAEDELPVPLWIDCDREKAMNLREVERND